MDQDTRNLVSITARNLNYQDYIKHDPLGVSESIQSVQDVKTLLEYITKLEQELRLEYDFRDKAMEFFEEYHAYNCGVEDCNECVINDCALRNLGLLLLGYGIGVD